MSTTGRKDDAGDPGSTGFWKHGFNLDCGLPGTLLLDRPTSGPWAILENTRATKNRFYIVRVGASKVSIHEVLDGKGVVAWVGHDSTLARMLVEKFNGYEMARDFPPKHGVEFRMVGGSCEAKAEILCAGEGGCCAHRRA